ncbi:MAG: DAK2 domain-containing protein [Oscillospiraceae bacterium]|nr:DAK2 domain-containing protein [Oscillospiraceae bacterium]
MVINGKMLRDAFISASVSISDKRREVDELNVYPVPDGDTGTNMSMTIGNTVSELRLMGDGVPVSHVADTAASALLRGARGNSGVILSLIFRGFSKGLQGKETAGPKDLTLALKLGVEGAYKSVMKPTEGTILTVARVAYEKAEEISADCESSVILWEEVCKAASDALDKTPEQLPVLKKAGVVDAGGKGLLVIFEAMLDIFKGGKVKTPAEEKDTKKPSVSAFVVTDSEEDINFTYCTEFIVEKNKDCPDALKLRAYLETIGDCVVVVEDDEIIKVHVHTDNPGKALQKALEFGRFVNNPKPKIENMRIQHEGKLREANTPKPKYEYKSVDPSQKYGFVAVAAGNGIEEMFKDLGVDCVVRGGQTMNPSTDDILQAIHATPAQTVFVLPNNKNIIMAAEQAVKLADRKVVVIPAKTIPQGISAMLVFDDTADTNTNRIAMKEATENVQTGQVTFAARDSEINGKKIKKGEILALENGKLAFSDSDVTKATYKLTKKLLKSTSSFITLIYGSDVTDEKAEETCELIRSKLGGKAEVTMINGGQPVYYYIISVE